MTNFFMEKLSRCGTDPKTAFQKSGAEDPVLFTLKSGKTITQSELEEIRHLEDMQDIRDILDSGFPYDGDSSDELSEGDISEIAKRKAFLERQKDYPWITSSEKAIQEWCEKMLSSEQKKAPKLIEG
ncbi:hypothetical protein [Anaerotruncus rubiinfantis]|uniref:hypothetical protein n=1 Tax=Anaerotruncus rubiinfantis TaxID=1720200 RepID=UPI003D7924C2